MRRVQRSADLRFAISDFCFRFDTPALAIRQGRRIPSATRIPPGQTPNMYFLKTTLFGRFQAIWSCPSS